MADPELDYQLMKVCKPMIRVGSDICGMVGVGILTIVFNKVSLCCQRFCTESEGKNILQCLKQNKNSELMDPKCKQMITKRQITQNTGIRSQKEAWSCWHSGLSLCLRRLPAQPGAEEGL